VFAQALILLVLIAATPARSEVTLLEQGYRSMYNLDFTGAHRIFGEWQRTHPGDPMGPISDAAAYLFAELDRMRVLESEFFTEDSIFSWRQRQLNPDPKVKREFEDALGHGQQHAASVLKQSPEDENALFANALGAGLKADYLSLIEKRNIAGLREIERSRDLAEQLLEKYPHCYDANVAIGVENYMLSLKPAPIRWALRLGGAHIDRRAGIERLRITAEKGRLLLPYARILLAIAALRDRDYDTAKRMLRWLASEFPGNPLYRRELSKLDARTGGLKK